jgi:hypothetical protein
MEKLYIEEMESRIAPVGMFNFKVEIEGITALGGQFHGFIVQLWQYIYTWLLSHGYNINQNNFKVEIEGVTL